MESHKPNGALHYSRAKELLNTAPPSVVPARQDDFSAVMTTEQQSAQVCSAASCQVQPEIT